MTQPINENIIREIPGHYLRLSIGALGILSFCTAALMAFVGGLASIYAAEFVWSAVYGVGMFGGLIIALLVLSLVRQARRALDSIYDLLTSRMIDIDSPAQNKIISLPNESASGYDGRVPMELGETEAQKYFRLALEISKIAFASNALEQDGRKVRGKPFQFRVCAKLGVVTEHKDWLAALQLLEQSGAGENLTQAVGYRWNVSNSANVENVLNTYYLRHGYVKLNGKWAKM